MGIDKLSWKSRVTIMITAFALALSVGMAFAQGQLISNVGTEVTKGGFTVKLLDNTDYCAEYCYSVYQVCGDVLESKDVVIDFKKSDLTAATVYNPSLDVKESKGCYEVKVEGYKNRWENVDNVPTFKGVEFQEFAWWNTSYVRRQMEICAYSGELIQGAYFTSDNTETTTQANGQDYRIIYDTGTPVELNRYNLTYFSDADTYVVFPLQANIKDGECDNTSYYVYYNVSSPADYPPVNKTTMFDEYCAYGSGAGTTVDCSYTEEAGDDWAQYANGSLYVVSYDGKATLNWPESNLNDTDNIIMYYRVQAGAGWVGITCNADNNGDSEGAIGAGFVLDFSGGQACLIDDSYAGGSFDKTAYSFTAGLWYYAELELSGSTWNLYVWPETGERPASATNTGSRAITASGDYCHIVGEPTGGTQINETGIRRLQTATVNLGAEENAVSDSASVTLSSPGDASYNTSNNITFAIIASTNGTLETCELWGNWSGSWAMNGTTNSVNNGSATYFNADGIPDGTFLWGAYCNATLGAEAWASNFTLTINTATPTVTVDSPGNSTYQTLPIPLNVTVSENAITCLYNIDGGANSTMSNTSGTNWYSYITGLTTGNLYNLTVWCNDTDGFHGTNSTIWFTYDSILEIRVFEESSPTTPVNGFSINITGDTGTLNFVSTSWAYEISTSGLDLGANTIRISNSSYYDRYYYVNITTGYNGSITAYLISTNETLVSPTFVVKNILDNPVADVLLTFQKLINGSYVTVAQRLTDDTGLTTVNLVSGESYRIEITYGSLTQYYSFTASNQEYLIILDETLEVDFTQPFSEIYVAVSPQTIAYNASLSTYNVTFSYTVYSNLTSITLYGFRLLCDGSQVVETNITSSGTTGGTLSTAYNVTLCSNMTLEYYFITSEFWGRSITYQIYQNQPYGLYEAVERAKAGFSTTQLNFLAVIILMLVAAGLSWLSAEGGALAGIIMGGIFAWFGIMDASLYIITAITLFSIMFIRRRWL